ncbi:MAG: hypothetical protein DRQ88_04775 [Epsilonproteobacteria bacterium]|nr:MAG: hypothetical protein DRQ88_04775 [Campylobacterota bacterium]
MSNLFSKLRIFIGPVLFVIVLQLPLDIAANQQKFLAIFIWVICGWILTSLPLFITGIFGVSASVIMGIIDAKTAFGPFGNPIIFLFMGGFFLAKAMERIGLDKKISLFILNLKIIHGHPRRTIMAIYLLTATFSMWVSNTATTAMMLPIVLGSLKNMGISDKARESKILIGMGYAATIGGLGTPIGSPPNMLALGFLATLANINFVFLSWFLIAFPITVVMLIFLYFNFIHSMDLKDVAKIQKNSIIKSGPLSKNEKIVISLFFTVVVLWFLPGFVEMFLGSDHIISTEFKRRLPAGVVSIFFSSLLFTLPLKGEKILGPENALKIDWASLLLFGSGLSLGAILFSTGLANTIADGVLKNISGDYFKYTLIVVVISTIYITEVISNTASANILIPIIIVSCQEAGINPLAPVLAVAMACNLAFMLPVSTPPNAIVFGSRLVKMKDMIRAGFIMNIFSALILSGVYLLLLKLF